MKFWRNSKKYLKNSMAMVAMTTLFMASSTVGFAAGEPATDAQIKTMSEAWLKVGGTVFPIGNDNAA